jgi:hypothetical protein
MSEWYRWDNETDAQAALDYLNNHPALPHVGVNAKTGQPEPDKCQTTKWCDAVTACTDGKFGFPRVTTTWLDVLGISEEDRTAFLTAFVTSKPGGVVEEFDPAWIPVVEDELNLG